MKKVTVYLDKGDKRGLATIFGLDLPYAPALTVESDGGFVSITVSGISGETNLEELRALFNGTKRELRVASNQLLGLRMAWLGSDERMMAVIVEMDGIAVSASVLLEKQLNRVVSCFLL